MQWISLQQLREKDYEHLQWIIAVPFVVLAWWYIIKFVRYLLDGVFCWGWWILKIVSISILCLLCFFSLAMNGYLIAFHRDIEPIQNLISFFMSNVQFVHFSWISAATAWNVVCDFVRSLIRS